MIFTSKDIILLVIAHPDDESMFFGPLLMYCKSNNILVHILCLSNGNFEGLGVIRQKELIDSTNTFNISSKNVYIVNDDHLLDGLTTVWSREIISSYVIKTVSNIKANIIITFDGYGISGHPNHIDTCKGVNYAYNKIRNRQCNHIMLYELESVHILRKFTGILDLIITLLISKEIIIQLNPLSIYQAMLCHKSQLLWYRIIFILISRYSYMNSFVSTK